MAGKTQAVEQFLLTSFVARSNFTVVTGSTTTSLVVSSTTGFYPGWVVQQASTSALSIITAIPDSTHFTISPAFPSAPLNGNTINLVAFSPVSLYLALFTVPPTDTTAGTEVTGGSYARQLVYGGANWSLGGTPTVASNLVAFTFPVPTADWGVIAAVGLIDAPTSGNLIWWNTIPKIAIYNGDPVATIPVGALTITED